MSHFNSTRLAKNTLALYLRTFLTMLISLYTSRVVLNTLGISDFGIYNVVGGIVILFSFLNSAMASGTQRFLNYEMGNENKEKLKNIFNTSLMIHFFIAFVIFILAETLGLWFLNTKMVIAPDRLIAANWVYQFSVFSAMISLTQVPYMASIIANEKMIVYGYIGMFESIMKLLLVYLLVIIPNDKLIVYAILMFISQLIGAILYRGYCVRNFSETRFIKVKDKLLLKEMLTFSGWNLLASLASVSKGQGQNIILNLFFGPVVNAARAVSMSISGITSQFVSSFMTAVNPQITKSYSSGDLDTFMDLIFNSSKFAFFLLSLITLPILINTQFILDFWLKTPPELSSVFVQLVLIDALVVSVSYPLTTSAQATGIVKKFHITVTSFELLNLPISYLLLGEGCSPKSVFFVTICMSLIALLARLFILKTLIKLPIMKFVTSVLLKSWFVFGISYFIMVKLNSLFVIHNSSFILSSLLSVLLLSVFILLIGIEQNEKKFLFNKVKEFLVKK